MSRIIAGLAVCLLTFISAACEKVPLLAPTGSTVVLNINTTTLPVNGTADITAIVIESGGTAPQNGTVVTFATTLGSIEPFEARTHNGRATARFLAGNRSGTASVRAFSGDAETEAIDVVVGGAGAQSVAVRAEAASPNGTVHTIIATVVDADGNTVAGAPVTFSSDNGQVSPGLVTADANGEARATLTTSVQTTVTATSGAATGSVTIQAPGAVQLEVQTQSPEVGVPVNFALTLVNTASIFTNVVIDFGDGSPTTSLGAVTGPRAFSHTYTARGTYTVTATATTATGTTSVSSVNVTVNERAPLSVTLLASPAIVSLAAQQGLTTLNAQVTAQGNSTPGILRLEWNFGDGDTDVTTGLSVPHRYRSANTFTARVRVVATDGRDGNATAIVRVTP